MSNPAPKITKDSEAFWDFAAQGKLMIRVCTACGNQMYYPRLYCTQCLSDALDWRPASGRGTVYSFSAIYRAAEPYVIALIDLEDGVRMMSNVTDCDVSEVRIGMLVSLWFDDAIPMFRPSSEATNL